ncbi:kinase-like protein [Hypoxylon sp. NC0597]|nr:kinase-like protein [Hypoxylon sp. NC0597]
MSTASGSGTGGDSGSGDRSGSGSKSGSGDKSSSGEKSGSNGSGDGSDNEKSSELPDETPYPWEPGYDKYLRRKQDVNRIPQGFVERYRSQNWRFSNYRTIGGKEPSNPTFGYYRTQWLEHPFPRKGRPKRRQEPVRFIPRVYQQMEGNRPLRENIQKRLDEAKEWFVEKGRFDFVRPLGYGGLGLTIQYKWRSSEAGIPDRDVVLKVALNGWDDYSIREEERQTRKVARAAHCIQQIKPEDIGLNPRTKFQYELPDMFDSSSEDSQSSGEESREDEPPSLQVPTRRWRTTHDPEYMAEKELRHRERIRQATERNEERQGMLFLAEEEIENGRQPDFDLNDWDADHKDYMVLEFMEHGDLAHFIYKVNELGEEVPNRVLWSFWICLIKACIAMEYPPRKFHARRREPVGAGDNEPINNNKGKRIGSDLFEDIPPAKRRWAKKRMVHFDIDPRNIFIGGFDPSSRDGEHELVPRLKLADFGCAQNIKPNKGNQYYFELRRMGKNGYLAPEQFGVEWEHIAPTKPDGWELSEQKIAGYYGSWTNIWGIALTMWQLITKFYPPVPPQQQANRAINKIEPVTYCALLLDDPKYERVDRDLRETLVRCMRHEPSNRPTLRTLLQEARRGVRRVYPNETDDMIRAWIQRIVLDAPPTPPQAPPESGPDGPGGHTHSGGGDGSGSGRSGPEA